MRKLRYLLLAAVAAGALSVPAALGGQAADNIKMAGHADIITATQVAVYVTYTCLPTTGDSSTSVFAFASLQGNPGHGSGSQTFTAICDSSNHSATVIITGGPFTPGEDAGFAEVCGSGCGTTGTDAVLVVLR